MTSVRLDSDTPSLRSISVPSDLQRGREVMLVVVVALIRWAAMIGPFSVCKLVLSAYLGLPFADGQVKCQQPSMISKFRKYWIKKNKY